MIKAQLKRVFWKNDLSLKHESRIKKWGHRAYVGGGDSEAWYGIGKRQYHFLVKNNLKSTDRFVDIACGSLRLGQYLIPMLNEGCYYGLEGEPELVRAGLEQELLFDLNDIKSPHFAYNYSFDFSFVESFDVAMAQSLFTHLTLKDITDCFSNLRHKAHESSRFYFTFFEGNESNNPDADSHANKDWHYDFSAFEKIASHTGWDLKYIGDWGHERDQKMVCATPSKLA